MADFVPGRIFVGRISQHTSEGVLRRCFGCYGSISQVKIARRDYGRYAFVQFEHHASAEEAVSRNWHFIDGVWAEVRRAHLTHQDGSSNSNRRLFVGGTRGLSAEVLRIYFAHFGEVADAHVMNGRGYAIITYREESSVDNALEEGTNVTGRIHHNIEGRNVEVKRFDPAHRHGTNGPQDHLLSHEAEQIWVSNYLLSGLGGIDFGWINGRRQ